MNIEVRHLRALVAVIDEMSFTDAAIALGVSQAAVSRSIAALEAELSNTLIERTTRAVKPTQEGERVSGLARRILADLDRIAHRHTPGEPVRLGFAWSALGRHTLSLQKIWSQRHPETPLRLVSLPTPDAGLAEGKTDIIISRIPLSTDNYRQIKIGEESRFCAMAADDVWSRRRFIHLSELSGRTLAIDTRTGSTTLQLWSERSDQIDTVETTNVDEWLHLIAGGEAVGLTAEATVFQHPRPGIKYVPVRGAPPITVWLVTRKHSGDRHFDELAGLANTLYVAQ